MNKKTEGLTIGVARIEITPPVGAVMVGYKARHSTGIAHPLRAEALFCRGPGGAWLLVTSDTIGYPYPYALEIRSAIAGATGLPVGAVILSGSHTHSGPCTVLFGRGEELSTLDADYLVELRRRLTTLAVEASQKATPGSFETAWTAAPAFGHNRRVQGADGEWTNEWRDPEGHHTGFFDPGILLVAVVRPGGQRDALLVNFGCHPVVLGPSSLDLSGDFVAYLREHLEAGGAAGTVMFALAACGNINPRNCIVEGAEHPRAAGRALASIVAEALPLLRPVPSGAVAVHSQPWAITRTREVLKRKERGEGQQIGGELQTEVVAARCGELGLLAIPGELFSEFNQPIREASPARDTIIVTVANDYIGYIPTDQAQQEGAYEPQMAPAHQMEASLMEHVRLAFQGVSGAPGDGH